MINLGVNVLIGFTVVSKFLGGPFILKLTPNTPSPVLEPTSIFPKIGILPIALFIVVAGTSVPRRLINLFFMGENMKHKKRTFGIVGRDYLPHLEEIKRIEKRKIKVDNTLVFCGLILVNIATFPSLFNVLVNGGTPHPASLTGLVMCGLFFYMARAIRNYRTEWVYAVGEFIGICSNGFLFVYALTV